VSTEVAQIVRAVVHNSSRNTCRCRNVLVSVQGEFEVMTLKTRDNGASVHRANARERIIRGRNLFSWHGYKVMMQHSYSDRVAIMRRYIQYILVQRPLDISEVFF
jgi:hypothetical protein